MIYYINENYVVSQKDIYYNKDKFDSGEINLCFITGHSGSGKSTMSKSMSNNDIEHYELDDIVCVADHFTMNELKKYGDLIYSYFSGIGKKFYVTEKYIEDNDITYDDYIDKLIPEFVHYAMKYANSHKDRKYIVEGIWLYGGHIDSNYSKITKYWFEPSEFDDYAFYIKGTSALISRIREIKRDSKKISKNKIINTAKLALDPGIAYSYLRDEKAITRFREYFKNK